ncbi:MAG: ATP-binding protein [Pseudomonadota bacterium]
MDPATCHTEGWERDYTAEKISDDTGRSGVFLETLMKTIPLSIDVLDEKGRILYQNDRLAAVAGKDGLGKTCSLVYRGGNPCDVCPLKQGVEIGKTKSAEVELLGDKTFSITYTGMIYRGKKAILRVLEDITDKKRLQEQLCQIQRLEAIGRLAGGVAHDFNNLLTSITGYSELLLLRLPNRDPVRKDIEKIRAAGERASKLTGQLLAFSRRQMLQPEVLSINTLIRDMEELIRSLAGDDIELITVLDQSLEPVRVDAGQIGQVVMNLVLNARDAMPEGGKLTIATENLVLQESPCQSAPKPQPGKYICLTVKDTGVGIDKEINERIFEPFFTTKGPGVGIGLGLSVVYGIVRQHEGCIKVFSEPGQGAAFKIYLPVVSARPEAEAKDAVSPERLQGNGERILLVEDQEDVRALAATVLRENGYLVYEAVHADDAADIFEREKGDFHLVFTDVVLPGRTGIQLVEQLLCLKPGLRVLCSSGYADQKSQWATIQKKGFPFLPKPYAVTDLLRAVRKAC